MVLDMIDLFGWQIEETILDFDLELVEKCYPNTTTSVSSDFKSRVFYGTNEQNMRTKLNEVQRIIFLTLTVIIFILAVVGNIATIVISFKRKHRLLYKSCLVSLAFSDLFLSIFTSTNNLFRFAQTYNDWELGDFLCSFIPLVQTMCIIVSSMTLCVIAIDRYQSVINALTAKWDPKLWMCCLCLVVVWIVSSGISVPMFLAYEMRPVLLFVANGTLVIDQWYVDVCLMENKHQRYIIAVFTVIFIPLLLTFISLHSVIAAHVWKRRQPFSKIQTSSTFSSPTLESPDVVTTSSPRFNSSRTNRKQPVQAPRFIFKDNSKIATWNQSSNESCTYSSQQVISKSKPTIHMERKMRTFKVIIVIMVTFFICRLPSWIFLLKKSTLEGVTGPHSWLWQYSFSTLSLANSAVNPFLYGLLNETLAVWQEVGLWFERHPCTCCCGKEGAKRCINLPHCQCKNEMDGAACQIVVEEKAHPATSTQLTPRSPWICRDRLGNEGNMNVKQGVDKLDCEKNEDYGGVHPYNKASDKY